MNAPAAIPCTIGVVLDDVLTLAEAAEILGLAPATLRSQIVRGGSLKGEKKGKTWFVHRNEVERYRTESLGKVGPKANDVERYANGRIKRTKK